jgi:hypothetical protein
MGLGERENDGERGSGKSDEAWGQEGHRSILGSRAAPALCFS